MNEQPNYKGREQSYIKHQFLTKYLEAAAFKIYQSKSKTINFIDAFAGPWKVKDEKDYSDASFSQAVRTLEDVRKYLAINDVKNLRLNSYFCEIDAHKVKQLNEYKDSHPNLNIKIFSGKFEDNLRQISTYCKTGFTFTFIDPTGWDIDSKPIFEFLRKLEGELIMNFMAEPINRHVTNPKVKQSFCRFLADPNWSERFKGYPHRPIKEREILKLLKQRIKSTDVAEFVPDFPIENPSQNRIKMRLLLGTNNLAGIEVFRNIQQKVEKEAIKMKEQFREDKTSQPALFTPEEVVALESNQSGVGCDKYIAQARDNIEKILSESGDGCEYYRIICEVLENTPIRKPGLNKLVKAMERSNSIELLYPNGKRNLSYETIIRHNDKFLQLGL